MRALKIQSKNLLNMKIVVNYLNFVFHIELKTKSKYKILDFVFQSINNTKSHFGYTDSKPPCMCCLPFLLGFTKLKAAQRRLLGSYTVK